MNWSNLAGIFQEQHFEPIRIKTRYNIHFFGFYKQFEDATRVILFIDNTTIKVYSDQELQDFEAGVKKMLSLLKEESEDNMEALFVIYTNQVERDLPLMEGRRCWIADTKSKSLLVFENQPADFAGMYKYIEESIFSGQKEERRLPVPWITLGIMMVNIMVFICTEMCGSTQSIEYMLKSGASYWQWEFGRHEYYRWFTCMFLHFGPGHLGNNMVVLYLVGRLAEAQYGKIRYAVLYFVSGIMSGICSSVYYMTMDAEVVSAGASGAIYGVIGAFVAYLWLNRRKMHNITARWILVLALLVYTGIQGETTDGAAHIGGCVFGILIGGLMLLYSSKKQGEKGAQKQNVS